LKRQSGDRHCLAIDAPLPVSLLLAAPVRPDLDMLWHDLGIRIEGRRATFDETAPKAATRRAISAVQEHQG